jgi:ribose transport system ATP-binding protein
MSQGSTGEHLLELSGISKSFGATVALEDVALAVRAGEVHALVGENGAGKSTLMNIVAGALAPDRGAMRVAGRPYAPTSPLDARHARIALIHQELSLCPHLTVAENIMLGVEPRRLGWLDRAECRRRAAAVLEQFGHPDIALDRPAGRLPVAAQQVVEICRALSADARILLMDEPTSTLPADDVQRLFALIRRLAHEGIAIIYISHFLEEVREIAERYTVLRDGRSVDTGEFAATSIDRLIAQMVGRRMDGWFPARPPQADAPASGEPLLEVRDLQAPPAVRAASFELRGGEILGIAGLMGSGRTEMVRALFGLDRAAAGEVRLRGRALALHGGAAAPRARLRQGFGYLSEDRKGEGLALPMSVADNLTFTHFASCARAGWLDLRRQRAQADARVRDVGIRARSVAQRVRTLSGGNQQKVAIGRLLHQNAEILLLDEPTRGIDIGSKAQVYEIILRSAQAGKAVLMVSSYLPELFGICHRIAVMSRGRLGAARPTGEWTPEGVLAAAIGDTAGGSLARDR